MMLHFFANGGILTTSDENVTGKVAGNVTGKDSRKVFKKQNNRRM